MANKVTDATIEYVGKLAKLDISVEEQERAKEDMTKMLNYIDMLEELDTTNVEPMSHIFAKENVFREDVMVDSYDRATMLQNAPSEKGGMFEVPKTFG